jgi:hypothetical protein
MLFVVTYKTSAATNRTGQERFIKTGGAAPPPGVRKIANYHYADGSGGYTIAESDDPIALAKWCNQWTDVLVFDARPVLTDEQLGKVLAG